MNSSRFRFLPVLAVFGLLASVVASFSQSPILISGTTTSSSINIGPSGSYKLTGDIYYTATSGYGILIAANSSNLVLDLNGYSVISTNNAGTGIGCLTTVGLGGGVTIKNGAVANFLNGIYLGTPGYPNPGGDLVENVTVRSGTNSKIGMRVTGPGTIVRNCRIFNIIYNTSSNIVFGIGCYGDGITVKDNDIYGVRCLEAPTRLGMGIYVAPGYSNCLVTDNRLLNCDEGIKASNTTSKLRGNIVAADTPISYTGGNQVGEND